MNEDMFVFPDALYAQGTTNQTSGFKGYPPVGTPFILIASTTGLPHTPAAHFAELRSFLPPNLLQINQILKAQPAKASGKDSPLAGTWLLQMLLSRKMKQKSGREYVLVLLAKDQLQSILITEMPLRRTFSHGINKEMFASYVFFCS